MMIDIDHNRLKDQRWEKQKVRTNDIKESYRRLGEHSKAERISSCGSYLTFKECPSGHEKRIINANFCRSRLCPLCSWRRSLKIFAEFRSVAHKAMDMNKGEWLFLTLTVKNIQEGAMLSDEITNMFQSWQRFSQRRKFRQSVLGWFRALEVTVNEENWSYHPHMHALLMVPPSYFSGKRYVKQSEWTQLWKESLRVDYSPIIDIRRVKSGLVEDSRNSLNKAILETAKYPVKPNSYIIKGNTLMTDTIVKTIDQALLNRRMIAYGGLLKEALHRSRDEKNLESIEKPCHCGICGGELLDELYKWQSGFNMYKKL